MIFDLPKELDYSFILSTGRTGTVFLSAYLENTTQSALCLHEPKPSRFLIPLSNKYYQNKISTEEYSRRYFAKRIEVIKESEFPKYIETSNFLWAGVHALNSYLPNIKVVHIIRHPQDYILSHLNFGFWSFSKRIIRSYAPYFLADQHLTKADKSNPIIILIRRWILINEHLETYQQTNKYLQVRFEDLFSNDVSSFTFISELRNFLSVEQIGMNQHLDAMNQKRNHSTSKKYSLTDIHPYIMKYFSELEPLMLKYNYVLKNG